MKKQSIVFVEFFPRFWYNLSVMFQIWAKVIVDQKIVRQTVYKNDAPYRHHEFFSYAADICYALDIPTPVVLKSHIVNFAKFNHVKFAPRDFLETVDFDALLFERILL